MCERALPGCVRVSYTIYLTSDDLRTVISLGSPPLSSHMKGSDLTHYLSNTVAELIESLNTQYGVSDFREMTCAEVTAYTRGQELSNGVEPGHERIH